MKGFTIVCSIAMLVAAVLAAPALDPDDPDCNCQTTPPPRPLVRCPEFVNSCCTPDYCNQAVGIPYPGDCTKFCLCDSLGAIEFQCPGGLVYDPVSHVCVWPSDSTCSNSDPYPVCNGTTTTSTAAPTSTTTPGVNTTTTRPPSTTTTRPPTTTTTRPPSTTTTTTLPPTTTTTTTLRPTTTTTTTTRPPTTTTTSTTTTRPPTTTTTSTTTRPPTTTTTSTTTTRPPTTINPGDPPPTPPCATDPPRPLVRCPACVNALCTPNMCNQAVNLPFPGDCSKFCKCDNGGSIEFDCAPGTVWDPATGGCNWPYESNCSNSDPYPGCPNTFFFN